MRQHTRKEITKIAQFLQLPVCEQLLNKVVENSTLQHMKAEAEVTLKPGQYNIMRSGRVNGWRTVLTEKQSEVVDEMAKEHLDDELVQFWGRIGAVNYSD